MHSKVLFLLLVSFLFSSIGAQAFPSAPQQSDKQIRVLINLLDYIGKDYSNAVQNGKVINDAEYREMAEFSRQAVTVFDQIDKQIDQREFSQLGPGIDYLKKAVQAKANPQKISELAGNIRQEIVALNLIKVSPPEWPDLKNGAEIFATYCQACHGEQGFGDGPLAANLTPPPSNFHDSTLASKLSPLQAYNTIRLGIEGTGMRAFKELSDQQVWDVAFYINSLYYQAAVPPSEKKRIIQALKDTVSLRALAATPNKKWYPYLKKQGFDVAAAMSVLRSMDKSNGEGEEDFLHKAIVLIHKAAEAYEKGNVQEANLLALIAYLEGVEPREAQIKASDPSLVSRIENQMIEVRSAIKNGVSPQVLREKINVVSLSIREAQKVLGDQGYSFWFTFIVAGSILLREGLEAFLIILVILSVLKSVGAGKAVKYIHGGWILALAIGIIGWLFAESLIQMSSVNREVMEGISSMIAVGLLLYIGFWLHNKTHTSQWTKFIKEKIHRMVDENNRWGLAFLSFIVVFREAFESVIFLSSISMESGPAGNSGILFGSISALVLIFILGVTLIKFTKKVPIRALFKYSALVMAILAIMLAGKGIHEFQEAGYLGIEVLPLSFHLPAIGLYPTLQTILAQLIILGMIIGLWYYSKYLAVTQEVREG